MLQGSALLRSKALLTLFALPWRQSRFASEQPHLYQFLPSPSMSSAFYPQRLFQLCPAVSVCVLHYILQPWSQRFFFFFPFLF